MQDPFDQVTARWNLLEHSFYRRWAEGVLTRAELCEYVGQYAHVVRAVPAWLEQVRGADSAELIEHVNDERSHIELWERFGAALGMSAASIRATPANSATAHLGQRGDQLAAKGMAAAAVWALEAQTPAVAQAKLDGLRAHYGIDDEGGGKYFAVHRYMDVDHATQLRALCPENSEGAVEQMSEGLWALLSSVEATE